MTGHHLLTFNGRSRGTQQPPPSDGSPEGAFRSGGQTYETPRRPSVSVPRPRPHSTGQPSGGSQRSR